MTRDIDLIGNRDALVWAEHFVQKVTENPDIATDVGTMLGWFAVAIEAGDPRQRAIEELLEAIRLTQEYAQLPALDGWSWWDVYSKHRPEDAERLRAEWQRRDAANSKRDALVGED